jgi:hypothetical protein
LNELYQYWKLCVTYIKEKFSVLLEQREKLRNFLKTFINHSKKKYSFSITFQTKPNVYLSHQVLKKSNSWAIVPVLIDIVNQLIKPQTKWLLVCEANSAINLEKLLKCLEKEDETKVRKKSFYISSINLFH